MAAKKRAAARTEPSRRKRSARAEAAPTKPVASAETSERKFLTVALGGSAGGLGALDEFFGAMPSSSGMAFVVVTHQLPTGPSLLRDLIARRTDMQVIEVTKRVQVEADHVYTSRPGFYLAISKGYLTPIAMKRGGAPPMPIDYFFRSLAEDQREHAVGIVLSGTGSDGTLGLQDIKAELGMVLAQDESSAQFSGMPTSAAATDLVDFVLPVTAMPGRLLSYAAVLDPQRKATTDTGTIEPLRQIFTLVRSRTGHDFSQYKMSTMRRRIERRMNVQHLETEKKYLRFLNDNPHEVDALFKELLIGVTSFFRDAEAWEALTVHLTKLLSGKPAGYVFRAWIPGCSTGQEAYSLAILLREIIDVLERQIGVQLFATDLDIAAIETARAGVYPASISADVSPKRLTRYFLQEDDRYRIKQDVREMVVFAPQNVISDPPFTKLDMVSCRNLLIYLEADLQRKLIPLFHYAMRAEGILFLGSSESINSFADLFSLLEKKAKVFRRRDVPAGAYATEFPALRADIAVHAVARPTISQASPDVALGVIAERALSRELIPPTVLVHERGEVVHILGRTGQFLEPAPGPQGAPNIFNMAREGLQVSLSAAIRQAVTEEDEVVHRGIELKGPGDSLVVDLRVRRLTEPEPLRGLLRISFVQAPRRVHDHQTADVQRPDRILELERELQYTRETQQSTLEQLETANEELKSTNEEMQSTNEELQSTNEELETSKEEMQSLNEELQTVNAELQDKVEELSRANNDMKNLLNGTNIATIFLDNDLNIKRYTEQAKKVIRLIPSDVGRSIGDLVSTLQYDRLVDDAREVLQTLIYKETEVRGGGDAWYLMRILPYRTVENVIDGLVLTFVDITAIRALQQEQQRLAEVLEHSRTRAFGHDAKLRYTWASGDLFGRDPSELRGKSDAELFGARAAKALVSLKTAARDGDVAIQRRVTLTVDGSAHSYLVYAEPVRDPGGHVSGITCVATELTEDS